ncbi:MAG: hypothetical protein F9K23_16355 [Bacteroidetes bacterium]|nr:MAG: hypothetical protein F9K23_16355 [Bacteroidota bacterium]
MKKVTKHNSSIKTFAGKIIFASAFLLSVISIKAQRCDVNGILFNQQAGFGTNSKIMIGGSGLNDGSICWNCYPDSVVFGRSRVFNRPVGIMPPLGSPVPLWSARIFQDGPANVMRIQTSQLGVCYDSVQWNRGISIRNDGNIGIGTDNTFGYKLAVNGSIIAKNEIRATLTSVIWPDYVFAPTYKLKPLSVLEAEIDSLGHLPEIPSASEVETDGLSLTGISTTLVKKVEELTLYIIEQQKQIEELKRKNGELQKAVEGLLKEKE